MTQDSAPSPMIRPPKFLVCVDQNEESRVALRFACIKAQRQQGNVAILHVLPPADFQPLSVVADKVREERRQAGEQLLQHLSEEANLQTSVTPSLILKEGGVGDEIITAVMEDIQINMLVLGAAKQSSKRGKLIAWLATQLGDRLLVPMMIVPGNLTDQQIEQLS